MDFENINETESAQNLFLLSLQNYLTPFKKSYVPISEAIFFQVESKYSLMKIQEYSIKLEYFNGLFYNKPNWDSD